MVAASLVAIALLLWQSASSAKREPDLSRFAVGAMASVETTAAAPPTPGYPFADAEGRETRLTDFEGRVVVLNTWAMWCAPCREEMPTLTALQAAYPEDRVLVLPVNIDRDDESVARARTFIAAHNLPFYGDRRFQLPFELPGEGAMPQTVILDRHGRIRAWLTGGADWSGPDALALIDAVAAED